MRRPDATLVALVLVLLAVAVMYGLQVEPIEEPYDAEPCDQPRSTWRRLQCAARAAFGVRKDA